MFTSRDGGSSWFTTNNGPANVSVDELFWLDNATLVAATHGRGMFRTTVLMASSARHHNGDGKADLLWRNAGTGDNYLYLMNGMALVGEGYLRNVSAPWTIVGTGGLRRRWQSRHPVAEHRIGRRLPFPHERHDHCFRGLPPDRADKLGSGAVTAQLPQVRNGVE